MNKKNKTINDINTDYLCMGCGECMAICPTDAIQMQFKRGQYYPKIDKSKCVHCGKCIDVCPGISISIKTISDSLWPENKKKCELGRFRKTYIGYSNNCRMRFNSASGGIATALICGLLRNGIIDGAILTRMSDRNPLRAESFLARTEEEVISAQTSKYCSSCPVSIIKQLKGSTEVKKIAFVGLPCHIHGIRKLQDEYEWINKRVILTVGLFCSHGVIDSGTELVLDKFANGKRDIVHIY